MKNKKLNSLHIESGATIENKFDWFIPSQYSLINLVPSKLSLKSSSYIILILGFFVGIFWLTILSQIGILSFIDTISSFFGPIFGIMIVDYYLIKQSILINKDIYSFETDSYYYYSNGWHLKGVYSIFIGFIFSASTICSISVFQKLIFLCCLNLHLDRDFH